ncbi:histidine--tRNA ligase [Plantibacter flavus]|uniref:histidine--tRNA ligase n=1 Tax=Plantibacter flavus TaxID=150123 RepID=UPI002379BE46|nr:histidine--tRNA ligase [Plantibacter flavus]MDD9152450.1 histidine--tRNA ligase [Plantibacter flavus]
MAAPVNPPRGMRDFLPADKARREHALGTIRRVFTAHGFDEIETPVVEEYDRLHSGLGGDNEKMAFNILRRKLTPEAIVAAADNQTELTDLGLRFDLTVPLARFYATHRAELPPVFRSIQIAPVWRGERPQQGRYRQFVQCDIDIIGESSNLAETELIIATLGALAELGITGCSVRINDRRLLIGMLESLGFPADEHAQVLITIDKLDKIGQQGVVAELRDRGVDATAVDALEAFFSRPQTMEFNTFGERAIRKALPPGADDAVVAELDALGKAVAAATSLQGQPADLFANPLVFDPFLVRGMGYYTGAIFEIAHPDLGYSLGGGGRYDGMIGRFLGQDVPAVGFSIGFERIVDLIELPAGAAADAVVLVHDRDVPPVTLVALKAKLVAQGRRVRLEARVKNLKALLDRVSAAGFGAFAFVSADSTLESLEFKALD